MFCKDELLEQFKSLGEELRFLLIVSNAQVKRVSNAAGPPVGAIKVAKIAKEGGLWIRVQATPGAQVRTLLASPPRGGLECRTSDDLRPLRGQCQRTRRSSDIRMNEQRGSSREHSRWRQRHSLVVDLACS